MAARHESTPTPRAAAVSVLRCVIGDHQGLDGCLAPRLERLTAHPADGALAQELVYGVLRWYWSLAAAVDARLERPLRERDTDVYLLLLVGLYQLRHMRIPAHAAVAATVSVCAEIGKAWAAGLVNAILRRIPRQSEAAQTATARWSHPQWLIERLRSDWPQHWQQIMTANNERPPMTLRVNRLRVGRDVYLAELKKAGRNARADPRAADAVVLERPVDVNALPGFDRGLVSVQDVAAQWVAPLLDARPGMRILDACAAPGGKTGHILEIAPDAQVVALDVDPGRCELTRQTLARLGVSARVICADAGVPEQWWDGRRFDRILVDAPCSGSGVIRRHPDIKHLRRPTDIRTLAERQRRLLDALWPLLAAGGQLLYVTCSVIARENDLQVGTFVARRADAVRRPLSLPAGIAVANGVQVLPGVDDADGFYYARLAAIAGR